jgi:hypothetical protein
VAGQGHLERLVAGAIWGGLLQHARDEVRAVALRSSALRPNSGLLLTSSLPVNRKTIFGWFAAAGPLR